MKRLLPSTAQKSKNLTNRLTLAFRPTITALCLLIAGLATPASAQLATIAATPTAATTNNAATPTAATTNNAATPTAATTNNAATPTAATTKTATSTKILALPSTPLPAATQGRSAVLGTTVPTTAGTAPPVGTAAVRPAVTHVSLWPKVWANQTGAMLNEQENCIAVAVYHEARGEPLDGQLAVAEVIMNRAASGRYPTDWCSVVKQPWQFSFVNPRSGHMPGVKADSAAWAYAQAITRIAVGQMADALPADVLWYHADYVAPSWGRRLAKVDKIGAHIFYRAS